MINFFEDTDSNYVHRTYVNASLADLTIAFAVDFSTSGEKCTKKAVIESNKKLIQLPLNIDIINDELPKIIDDIKNCKSLNVAGNGLSTLCKHNITQKQCDEIILYTLKVLKEKYGIIFDTIRSGGQTGADESGLKAAMKIGTKNIISLCPKGWRFRDEKQDYYDENLFKKRFFE